MAKKKVEVKRGRGRPRKVELSAVEQLKREAIVGYKPVPAANTTPTATSSTTSTNKPDPVNHPAHYTQGGVECIDALAAATVGLKGLEAVCTANAIKYLWRWKTKGGMQDLQKARWYLDRLISEAAKQPVRK